MEIERNQNHKNENNSFLNDIDFEDLNFAVLDKGLGFHHKEKNISESVKTNTYELKNQKLMTTKSIKEINVPTLKNDMGLNAREITLDEAFGVQNKPIEVHEKVNEQKFNEIKIENRVESSLEKVAAAWAVDLILIFISIVIALVLFMSATGLSFNEFKSFLLLKESQFFILVFFMAFYFLYFSILDINSSPGKLIFGTRLVSLNNNRLTVFNTFSRSLIILISIPLFLLPIIFGFHNKLSNTICVEEKW